MQFIETAGWDDGIADLTERLVKELSAGKQVLWLVSGGSNIQASVQVMDSIPRKMSTDLNVMLADERFGEVGHADSNWAQLTKAGFKAKKAKLLPVLRPGQSFESARDYYEEIAKKNLVAADMVIAQLGIGDDGHTAGILPNSPAVGSQEVIAAYEGGGYKRLTMTFKALEQIDAAYVFAFGSGKAEALSNLKNQALSLAEQPAQVLKQLPEAFLYNNQIGGNA